MKDYKDYDEDFLIRQGVCRLKEIGIGLLIAIAICLLCTVFVGCKTYVPVETVRTEYIHSTDTVRQTDSIFRETETVIRETNSGDSALLSQLGIQLAADQKAILILMKELEKEKEKEVEHRTDTVIKVDSVQVPYPVEKKIPFWEKVKIGSVGFVGALAFGGVVGVALWLRRRYKRK